MPTDVRVTVQPPPLPPPEGVTEFASYVSKRLRALNKRLTRIDKVKQAQASGKQLDDDQLVSTTAHNFPAFAAHRTAGLVHAM